MRIYPAIDIKDGVCVRLKMGDMDQATQYGDAVQMARKQFLANPRFAQQQNGKFRFGHDVQFAQQFQQLWTLSDDFCVTRLSGQRGGRFLTEPSRPQAAAARRMRASFCCSSCMVPDCHGRPCWMGRATGNSTLPSLP